MLAAGDGTAGCQVLLVVCLKQAASGSLAFLVFLYRVRIIAATLVYLQAIDDYPEHLRIGFLQQASGPPQFARQGMMGADWIPGQPSIDP